MTPTVGRIVHFYTKDTTKQTNGNGEGPYAAIVTQTIGDGPYINLKVFPPFSPAHDEGSVSEQGTLVNQQRWWEWPPRD